MLKKNQLVYLWCLFLIGILLSSVLRGSNWNYPLLAVFDSSRWAHFLAYVLLSATPVAAWKYRRDVAFCFVPVLMSVALESFQAHAPGPSFRIQNVSADMFGVAAGILLGLNLRMMRDSTKPFDSARSNPSGPDS